MAEEIKTYQEVILHLDKQKREKHLLLGNGFSMSYDTGIFSYNALANFIKGIDNKELQQLFEIVNTNNFELLMQHLDNAYRIAEVFGADKIIVDKIKSASETLKSSLIDAIKALHPEHVFTIEDKKSQACAGFCNSFLSNNGNIFTTNYDLLLYWVTMRNGLHQSGDGFGRDVEDTGEYVKPEDVQLSELRWGRNKETQQVHYLHGALHLFDAGTEIVKEEYDSAHYLITKVKERMEQKEYPIFVTAGSSADKLTHIKHNDYLTFCYNELSNISGSLICYGFGFGPYDEHIIKAINKAGKGKKREDGSWHKLYSVYIGVYSDDDVKYISKLINENKFKVPVRMFDAKTLNVWGTT